ncbi:MAG: PIN domain-containing protein [Ignavibacteria bacterium]
MKDLLISEIKEIQEDIKTLFLSHSQIYYENYSGGGVIVVAPDHHFKELDEAGKKLQNKIFKSWDKTFPKVKFFLSHINPQDLREIENHEKWIIKNIQQSYGTYKRNVEEVWNETLDYFSPILDCINSSYSKTEGKIILIADTNSLLFNPNLEKWNYGDFNSFSILLTSTVLSELDLLKINSRNESVRDKAKTIINKIKEYRRRGNMVEGVDVVKNKISMLTDPLEPDFENSLVYLDSNNKDDRLIATTLEIIRNHSESKIYLVTSDINLQNKADYSCIPFLEPPEIV